MVPLLTGRPRGAFDDLRGETLARPAPPSLSRPRLPFIDGLRGLAMLMVLSFHCCQGWVRLAPTALGGWHRAIILLLRHGYLGVNLFLVLSGFCLTYPLVRTASGDGAAGMRLDLRRFLGWRAWRILPPYYLALALFCLLPVLEAAVRAALGRSVGRIVPFTAGQVLSHLLMIHNFSSGWVLTINGAFWSLALEWQLYLVFPLLIAAFRRWGPARTLTAALLVTLAYRSWVYSLHAGSGSWPLAPANAVGCWLAYGQVPGRVSEFVAGMLAAVLLAGRRSLPSPTSTRCCLAGSILFGLLAFGVAHRWSPFSPITDILWGMAFFYLVLYAGGRSAAGGGWLEARPLVGLGTISYSVYLLHQPLIWLVVEHLRPQHLSPLAAGVLFGGGVAPLLIALGWLYYRAVESRFIGSARPFAIPLSFSAAAGDRTVARG